MMAPSIETIRKLLGIPACMICSGTGKLRNYHYPSEPLRCHFCDGTGTTRDGK